MGLGLKVSEGSSWVLDVDDSFGLMVLPLFGSGLRGLFGGLGF